MSSMSCLQKGSCRCLGFSQDFRIVRLLAAGCCPAQRPPPFFSCHRHSCSFALVLLCVSCPRAFLMWLSFAFAYCCALAPVTVSVANRVFRFGSGIQSLGHQPDIWNVSPYIDGCALEFAPSISVAIIFPSHHGTQGFIESRQLGTVPTTSQLDPRNTLRHVIEGS